MKYGKIVKQFLKDDILDLSAEPKRWSKNAKTDFTRKRKLPLETLLLFLISKENDTTGWELKKFFDMKSKDVPSVSAFYQQRQKLKESVFPTLLKMFNSHFSPGMYRNLAVFACDGTEYAIFRNPEDRHSFTVPTNNPSSTRGFNAIHATYLYSPLSMCYQDVVIQPNREKNEFRAICELIDRFEPPKGADNGLFIADRGFFSFNSVAHFQEKNLFFLIRVRNTFAENLNSEFASIQEECSREAEVIITRSCCRKNWKYPDKVHEYKVIRNFQTFDCLPLDSVDEFILNFRIVKLKLPDGTDEYLATNLPDTYTLNDLRVLYSLRWNEETSFRRLKHTIGGTCFLSKKLGYVTQEIWARMILFNFCMRITCQVQPRKKKGKYRYQLNYDDAIKACHYFLRLKGDDSAFNLESLIRSSILPIRPGRNFERRKLIPIPLKFAYRR